jgi:transcriptional regulator with XRE-family HTH domain
MATTDPAFEGLGKRVKELRLDHGWTQRDLAAAMDRSLEAVARVERGWTTPHPHTIRRLADALDTYPAWLLRAEGPKRRVAPPEENVEERVEDEGKLLKKV